MNLLKKLLIVPFFMLMLLLILPVNSKAYDYEVNYPVREIKAGESKKVLSYNPYHFAITEKSIITIKVKNGQYSSARLLRHKEGKRYYDLGEIYDKRYYVIEKGDYYLEPASDCTILLTIKKMYKDQKNYSMKRAANLDPGKKQYFINEGPDSYRKWYKIELTKKKYLSIYAENLGSGSSEFENWTLLDAKGKILYSYIDHSKNLFKTKEKLKKGTYYIVVYDDINEKPKYKPYNLRKIYWY